MIIYIVWLITKGKGYPQQGIKENPEHEDVQIQVIYSFGNLQPPSLTSWSTLVVTQSSLSKAVTKATDNLVAARPPAVGLPAVVPAAVCPAVAGPSTATPCAASPPAAT